MSIPYPLAAGPFDQDATEPHETQAPFAPVKEQRRGSQPGDQPLVRAEPLALGHLTQ